MPKHLVKVTPVIHTDANGETYVCCSRSVIDPACLWEIFRSFHKGQIDLYQALTILDGRRFERKSPLSKSDINRARNIFRSIEKHGRQRGEPCVAINGRADAIQRQRTFLNKDIDATNEYWNKRARAAAVEAARLPRGKTGIRLANIALEADIGLLNGEASRSLQIAETYEARADQLIEPIGRARSVEGSIQH